MSATELRPWAAGMGNPFDWFLGQLPETAYRRSAVSRGTVCHRGHPQTPDNVYTAPDGRKACRECKYDSQRAWHARSA